MTIIPSINICQYDYNVSEVHSDLARALLGSIAPGIARRAALLGSGAVPHVPIFSVPLAARHAHLLPSVSPAILHRFGA